jgi:hypothetical protein
MDFDAWLMEGDSPAETLRELLLTVQERQVRGSRSYYKAFPPAERALLHGHYRQKLPLWAQTGTSGGKALLVNAAGSPVSRGWTRIVIGDYGAFVEFSREQACVEGFTAGTGGSAYNWLRTRDAARTKVYEQLRGVMYADYQPGLFYVDPADVHPS